MREILAHGDGVTRLDVLLSQDTLSRSQATRLIREGQASVSGRMVNQPSYRAKAGEEARLTIPEETESRNQPENIPLRIIFQDKALAVVDKPAGLVVHPAAGNPSGTLVNALLFHLDQLSGIGGEKRPGIVHRLDKDTSGLMLVAKNDRAHTALSQALARRQIEKHYLAVVAGILKHESGRMDGPIARSPKDRKRMAVAEGGREALTLWQMVRQDDKSALVIIRLVTGRTHQIRVHFSHAHHPVLGDPLYGFKGLPSAPRLMLHAWSLAFTHPFTNTRMVFTAPPEAIFKAPGESGLMAAKSRLCDIQK
ncbi:MAG: RluA family pseudouridine synthase [Eubacteriales bacterium]|nr:RluA family pseudouridine synthase [Eubacteriales bacterium]MDD3572222.1 RluA family pseudouridine synthase [Eubacteriales bacterium]MDD4133989.1 RluA family pseudouridine synthase [Eubacteriales bacterium]